MMLHCSNEVHAHLLHPVLAHDLINQLAKKLDLSRETCEDKMPETESTTSMMMTMTISSRESSCLANCRPVLFYLFLYRYTVQRMTMNSHRQHAPCHVDYSCLSVRPSVCPLRKVSGNDLTSTHKRLYI